MIYLFGWNICLLGKAGDWVTWIGLAIGFVIWLVSQLAGQGAKKAGQAQRRARRPQPRRPVPPPRRSTPAATGSPARPAGRPTPPPRRTPVRSSGRPQPSKPAQPPRRSATVQQKQRSQVGSKKLSTLENRHLETTIHPRSTTLPEGTVPDNLEIHVEREFSHQLGELFSEQRPEAEPLQRPLSPVAQEIVNTLRNPQEVRKAVVIAEILRRPEF